MIRLSPQNEKRLRRFKSIRRGWVSLWILVGAYVLSLGVELFVNNRPLKVTYGDETYYPALNSRYYSAELFGSVLDVEPEWRELRDDPDFVAAGGSMILALHPYSPLEHVELFDEVDDCPSGMRCKTIEKADGTTALLKRDAPPSRPRLRHPFGTDNRGRDVLARLLYGFRISISFALGLAVVSFILGIVVGAVQAYYGGWLDLIFQRLTEIWVALPFFYVVLMVASVITPNFWILIAILSLWGWVPVSRYTRAEVLRERSRDYVTAARAQGASAWRIMFIHAMPNSLTPLVTLFPFRLVLNIFSLTALDFLGYGLPAPTPSWGELFKQARGHLDAWWLTLFPFLAVFLTLLLTTFVGEAVREAWDPKAHHAKD